jgi:hypothetical protein
MADKADIHHRPRANSPIGWLWSNRSAAERTVLRDIWLYAGMLFVVGGLIAGAGSLLAQQILWPLFLMLTLVCISGALILHLDTLDRWARARRKGEQPDLTRVFD